MIFIGNEILLKNSKFLLASNTNFSSPQPSIAPRYINFYFPSHCVLKMNKAKENLHFLISSFEKVLIFVVENINKWPKASGICRIEILCPEHMPAPLPNANEYEFELTWHINQSYIQDVGVMDTDPQNPGLPKFWKKQSWPNPLDQTPELTGVRALPPSL